jgi:hypothetical protein
MSLTNSARNYLRNLEAQLAVLKEQNKRDEYILEKQKMIAITDLARAAGVNVTEFNYIYVQTDFERRAN